MVCIYYIILFNKENVFYQLILLINMKIENHQHIPEDNQYLNQKQQIQLTPLQRSPFGNMVALFSCFGNTITIGPNYIFFSVAWTLFSLVAYGIIKLVLNNSNNLKFQIITIVICTLQPLSYLLVALSNPGVVQESVKTEPAKICKKCNLNVIRSTYHCSQCDVCIDQYDHHCPWVSKCIGKNNLLGFYSFIVISGMFLIYSIVAIVICTDDTQNNLVKN